MFRLAFLFGLVALLPLVAQPQIGNCAVFPARNIWNTPVDKLPVHPLSSQWIATEGATRTLHPDFGPAASIPYVIVPGNQPRVPINFTAGAGNSEPGPYPIPPDAPIEAGDSHVLVLNQGECKLYELYNAQKNSDGSWTAESGAIFDLRSNALRPDGWTSADAAGLPILPGLVRYDEVASGAIRHAIRLTVPQTRRAYVWPARHFASRLDADPYPPMGQRFRLRADYGISGFHPMVQVILQALKTYGMMLADNGSSWFITGAPDPRWNDDILAQLKQIKGSDLEAVDVSSLMVNSNSGLALDPNSSDRIDVPFSATPTFDVSSAKTVSMTLTGDVTGATAINLVDGQSVTFLICQDDAGGHAFTWPPNVLGGMQVGTDPGSCSAQTFVNDGTKLYATSPGVASMK
jgi:hypothetical protein